ncbi:MAG: azurin [Chitinophagales bacterium]|nr:azurin [Chitinophagales bacterium]
MKKLNLLLLATASFGFFFTACNSGNEAPATEETATTEEVVVEETPAAEEATAETVKIEINSNDQMKYDRDELRVPAGSTVELTLHHTGTMAINVMGHNVVILKQGVDMADFATAAMTAKDNDYIPADRVGDVIAHTKTIGGGESATVTFEAPEAGTYDFMCSFPGHYSVMKGKFIVE